VHQLSLSFIKYPFFITTRILSNFILTNLFCFTESTKRWLFVYDRSVRQTSFLDPICQTN